MALRGGVEDYGLADILQLIAASAKSGRLNLVGPDDEISISIQKGWVVDGDTPHRPRQAEIAYRLQRAGLLNKRQLGQVLKTRADTGKSMGEVLSSLELIRPQLVKRYVTADVRELAFLPFTWQVGTYEFFDGAPVAPSPWVESFAVRYWIQEGLGIMDVWPKTHERLAALNLTIGTAHTIPDLPAYSEDDDPFGPPVHSLRDLERLVHSHCVRDATVQTIMDIVPYSSIEVRVALYGLLERGYIEFDASEDVI
jgi:hypothetical protein